MEEVDEFYCYFPAVLLDQKYTYSCIYSKFPQNQEALLVVGVIAISDIKSDHCIMQFFEDVDITEYFLDNFVGRVSEFSEDWLVRKYLEDYGKEDFIIGMPLAVPARTAKDFCDFMYDKYESSGYTVKNNIMKEF